MNEAHATQVSRLCSIASFVSDDPTRKKKKKKPGPGKDRSRGCLMSHTLVYSGGSGMANDDGSSTIKGLMSC